MCTVDKLLIKGVRSFSPDNTNVIEFQRPLTLIVGSNGAGKTTIIECLKQACTGELPPNTRSGQSFIHDPKVAGETEVKAQIKLRFRTGTGQPVVALRSFQLIQKKTALQFKTLDSVLQTMNKDTGEKQALTYKCADIDRIIPSLMGVSKAVLENVIFVHQEDSNWPLAEGTVLKKKFDDIFAATKYTKALEALRKIRTEKVQQVKLMEKDLLLYANHKEQATRLKDTIAHCKEEQTRLRSEIEKLDPAIQEQDAIVEDVNNKFTVLVELEKEEHTTSSLLQERITQTAELFAHLKDGDFEEDSSELEEWLRDASTKIDAFKEQGAALEDEAMKHKAQAKAFHKCLLEAIAEEGVLKAEATQQQNRLQQRAGFLIKTATQLSLPLPPGATEDNLSEADVAALSSALQDLVVQLERSYSQLKASNRQEDERFGAAVTAKTSAISTTTEGIRSREEALKEKKRKMEDLEGELGQVLISEAVVAEIRGRQQDAKQRLAAKEAEEKRENLGGIVAKEAGALDEVRRKIAELKQERSQAQAATEGQTRLKHKHQDVLAAQESLDIALASKRSRLLSQLGTADLPPVEELKSRMQAVSARKKLEAQEAAQQLTAATARHSSLQGELRTVQRQVDQGEAELADAKRKLREGLKQALGKDEDEGKYKDTLDSRETAAQAALKKVSLAGSMLHVMQSYREAVCEGDSCPVCRRHFQEEERQQCLEYMDEEIQVLPAKLAQKEAQLKGLQQQVKGLRELEPLWHRTDTLASFTLPPLREKLLSLRQEVDTLSAQVDEAVEVVAVLGPEELEVEKLVKEVVIPISTQHEAVRQLQAEEAALQRQLAAGSSSRTVAHVDSELEAAERERDDHQRAHDEARASQHLYTTTLAQLRSAFHTSENELRSATYKLDKQLSLKAQIAELEAQIRVHQTEITDLRSKQKPLEAERDQLQSQQQQARVAATGKEREADGKLREATKLQDQLASRTEAIKKYQAAGKEAMLQRLVEKKEQLQEQIKAEQEAEKNLQANVEKVRQQLADLEPLKRDIHDVLAYRRSKEAENKLREEKQQILAQMAQMEPRQELVETRAAAERQRFSLKQQQDILRGKRSSEQETMQQAMKDLKVPQYQGIEDKYRMLVIKLKTTEMANSDIEKYHKALEKALLAFHSSKMSEINRVMKELWQKTYRGQDIDYIAIKADAEGARSYNYRVVMYSGNAELEMRGRCSAGQKVLASLIIRLALAETFCLSCGILALDEPTTNLDAENAASLADALSTVMKNRAEQENFQLIVITHDERFANLIGTREHTEVRWRVTKDDKQHTLVRAEAVMD